MNRRYLIGEIAKYFDISTDTLRYYHKQGILVPTMDKHNGYRYYTYDDIIRLTYLLTLKNLDVKLVDIKRLLTNCTLEELKNSVEEQQKIIEEKLSNLNKLKDTIDNFKEAIDLSLRLYGKYEVIESPRVLYKIMDDNFGEKITKEIEALEETKLAKGICYTTVISRDCFSSNTLANNFHDGVSGIVKENVDINNKHYILYETQKSLHTIIKVEWSELESCFYETNKVFLDVKKYIEDSSYNVIGNILCRYITFETHNDSSTDYIELWIPIE